MGLFSFFARLFDKRERCGLAVIPPASLPSEDEDRAVRVEFDYSEAEIAEIDRVVRMRTALTPPPLPCPNKKYALYSQGDGVYDIDDGGDLVGHLLKEEGDEEHAAVWGVRLGVAEYDFTTFKAAKEWLGSPPVRRYR